MNKITFLGTAGDMIAAGKGLRSSGGIVLSSGNAQVHIDPGPGALIRMHACGVAARETNLILLSHPHINHAAGVAETVAAMTLGGVDKKGTLIAHASCKDAISSHEKSLLEKYPYCEEGKDFNVGQATGQVHIKALPTKNHEGVGFFIRMHSYAVAYTSDTEYSAKLAQAYRDANVLIINCPLPPGEKAKGRMNLDDAMKLIADVVPDVAIITHFSSQFLGKLHDHIDMARTVQKATGVQTIFAKDGFSFDPVNYSAQLKQKSLGNFVK